MKFPLIFLCLFGTCSIVKSQPARESASVRYLAVGAYSKKFADAFSITHDPAVIAHIDRGAAGVYGERRFMLQELNSFTGVVVLATSSGTVGLQANYFGDENFSESRLALAYGRKVSNDIVVGANLNYHHFSVVGYGNASAVNFDIGMLAQLSEKLYAGVHVSNPFNSRVGKAGNENIASVYKAGFGYEASDVIFLSGEIIRQQDVPLSFNAALQYNLHKQLFIRTGIYTATANLYAGFGLSMAFFRLDITANYHRQLGFTPGLSLLFHFNKDADND